MSGEIRDTYLAAIQHDIVDLSGDERLVGVVRRPTGWFRGTVDENVPSLGPPEQLLDDTNAEHERLKAQGVCDEEAHNAAWESTSFEERYRRYLRKTQAAQDELDRLAALVRDGETVVLVCFEGENKRCHRRLLREILEERVRTERGG